MSEQKKVIKTAPNVSGGQGYGGDDAPDTSSNVHDTINDALGKVTVMYGASEVSYELAGKSVAYIREALGVVLGGVPPDAQVRIDGKPVDASNESTTILSARQTCEFMRPSGQKGVNLS